MTRTNLTILLGCCQNDWRNWLNCSDFQGYFFHDARRWWSYSKLHNMESFHSTKSCL
jgi:hypothetical protein